MRSVRTRLRGLRSRFHAEVGPGGRRSTVLETVRPRWDLGTAVLRLLVLALPLAALWATVPMGATPGPWVVPSTVLSAVLWAIWPGSSVGVFALGFPVLWWATGPADGMSPWALLAAAALLLAHVCAHVASVGPPEMPFDRSLTLLWLRRSLVVLPAAPLVYVVSSAAVEGGPAWVWVAGMGVACCLFAAAQWALRDETRA